MICLVFYLSFLGDKKWQSQNFTVKVGNGSESLNEIYEGNPNENEYTYYLNSSAVFQYIEIEGSLPQYITVCEIEVTVRSTFAKVVNLNRDRT